ncbi:MULTISPECIES: HAMP domain-containing sensor histidine kinase [Enterococcus]|uniref:HAMP domain-containing sensor histidine kinase n=1 Tax=Enterococcus TaxID=1350 RepID=UPI00065E7134|nr:MULTISPECIES: HAMP domain-containing histidine kinase [Enterococcus]KAF1303640.1 two-component sensor histidine kinase [Enterococcus sp. JM9B]
MIKFKEKISSKGLKGPSLTIKWAFASSFFIFVVFTIFAVITYKSSVNLIVAKERKNVEQTISGVASRLANADSELTLLNTYRNLTNNSSDESSLYDRTSTVEGNLMKIDPFISELGQDALSLYVYNLEEKLVFKTHSESLNLFQEKRKDPTIITLNGITGFLSIQPIYSKDTTHKIGYAQTFYELSSFYEIRSKLLFTLIVLEVISLILSSILGFFLSAYFLKPLKVLRDTMDTIRKDPESDAHMPEINTNDELADLAEIFNEMLDRMRTYIEQQKQFVEDVSHELRTPVAIMEGHLSMLQRWGKDDPEVLDESIAASVQELRRMKSLVQEMLDLSRAEQVDIQYTHETTNAKEVTYQVFNNFKMLYPEFTFTLDDDLTDEAILSIYRNHFEQIIIIILDNAVKYSTERKEVHISISRQGNEFELAIQDFGEGVSEEDLNKIFNRFYRVDKARARTKGGNGLGLSIAKQLLASYKGRIAAESVVGQGTIFRIYIPIQHKK